MNVKSLISHFEIDQKSVSEHVPVKLYFKPQPNIREIIPKSGPGKRKSSTSDTIRFLDSEEKKRVEKGLGIIRVLPIKHNIADDLAASRVEKEPPTAQVQSHDDNWRSKTSVEREDVAEELSFNGTPKADECLTMRQRHSENSTELKLVGDLHFSYLRRPQSDDLDELDFVSAFRKMNGSIQLEVLTGNTELQIASNLQKTAPMVDATLAKSLDPQPATSVSIDIKYSSEEKMKLVASESEMEKEAMGQSEQKEQVEEERQNLEEKRSNKGSNVNGASTSNNHNTFTSAFNHGHHKNEAATSVGIASSHYTDSIVDNKNYSPTPLVKYISSTPTQFSSPQTSQSQAGFDPKPASLSSVAERESTEDSCYSTILIQDYLEDEEEHEFAAKSTISAPHQAPVHNVEAPSTPVLDSPATPDEQQSIFATPKLNRKSDTLLQTQHQDYHDDNARRNSFQSSEPIISSVIPTSSTASPPRPDSSPPMLRRYRQPNQNMITNIEETIQSVGGHETLLPELTFAKSKSRIWWVFPKFKKRKLSNAKTKSRSHIIDKISTPTNVRDLAFEDFYNLAGTQIEHPVVKFIERFEPARLLPVMVNTGVQTEPLKVSAAFRMARKAINDARSLHMDAKKLMSRLDVDCIGDLDEALTERIPFCYRKQFNTVEAFERYIDGVFRLRAV